MTTLWQNSFLAAILRKSESFFYNRISTSGVLVGIEPTMFARDTDRLIVEQINRLKERLRE